MTSLDLPSRTMLGLRYALAHIDGEGSAEDLVVADYASFADACVGLLTSYWVLNMDEEVYQDFADNPLIAENPILTKMFLIVVGCEEDDPYKWAQVRDMILTTPAVTLMNTLLKLNTEAVERWVMFSDLLTATDVVLCWMDIVSVDVPKNS